MNTDTISPPPTNTTLREHLQSLDEAITASGSHNGISLHQYVARHGKPFESTELTAEEEALISQIDFRNCQPRQCYRNCQMAALTLPLPPGHTLRYAEGFFAMNWNIGIEHAWLTTQRQAGGPHTPDRKRCAHTRNHSRGPPVHRHRDRPRTVPAHNSPPKAHIPARRLRVRPPTARRSTLQLHQGPIPRPITLTARTPPRIAPE